MEESPLSNRAYGFPAYGLAGLQHQGGQGVGRDLGQAQKAIHVVDPGCRFCSFPVMGRSVTRLGVRVQRDDLGPLNGLDVGAWRREAFNRK